MAIATLIARSIGEETRSQVNLASQVARYVFEITEL